MSRFWPIVLLLAVGFGCGSSANRPKTLRIAVIPKGTTHEFWKSVHAGAEKAAKELGDVEIDWIGPPSEDKRGEQIGIVRGFIAKRMDGICLAPLDSQALVPAVSEAHDAGIPVVIFDSGLADESAIASYVATDNLHGGQLAAEALAKELGGKGRVILFRYAPGSESTEQRERGFLEGLKKFPDMQVVAEEYAGATETSALQKAQPLVNTHKGAFDGVFACNESAATGMLQALENAELAGKVKFIGFDTSSRMIQAIRDGHLQGLVLQDPVEMGYQAVKTVVAKIRKQDVPKRVATGEYLATKENLDDAEIKKRLQPEQFKE